MTKQLFERIEANKTATQYIIIDNCVYVRHSVSVNTSFDENGIAFERSFINPSIVKKTAKQIA